jgi:chromosome segregation ATPase
MRPLLLCYILLGPATLKAQTGCDSLKSLLGAMLGQYDALSVENQQIGAEMDRQRSRIDSLRAALHRGRYDLEKARKEAEVLRGIMKGYIVTIDSLNASNKELRRAVDGQHQRPK